MNKQTMYLNKVMVYMKMMDHAFEQLSEAWNQDIDNDVELNDYLSRMYPFDKSFDELQRDVREWVRDYSLKLERERPEPKCHIHADDEWDEDCPLCNPDEEKLYLNHYKCPCGHEWSDEWTCQCNDKCPECNKEIEPCDSEEVGEVTMPEFEELLEMIKIVRYFVIFVWADVEPTIHGPYATPQQRDNHARTMQSGDEDESGIYWMNEEDGQLTTGSYPATFFEND